MNVHSIYIGVGMPRSTLQVYSWIKGWKNRRRKGGGEGKRKESEASVEMEIDQPRTPGEGGRAAGAMCREAHLTAGNEHF